MKTAILALIAVLAATAAQAQGSISGCVEDDFGGSLPGVGIVVNGPDGKHSTVTDARGCYTFSNLATGHYTLTAELSAFKTVNRKDIVVVARETATIDFWMTPSGTVEIDWPLPAGGLAGLWKLADTIVRVHIDSSVRAAGRAFAEHTGTIIEVFKGRTPATDSIAFRQELWAREPTPYSVGQDLVAFLTFRRGAFYRTCGWFSVFLIEGDYIEGMYREVLSPAIKAEDFIAKLRALSKEDR